MSGETTPPMKKIALWPSASELSPTGVDWSTHPLSQVLNPVAIMTTRNAAGDTHNGMTVGWVTWTSAFPPMVAVSVAPERHSFAMVNESKVFGLSYLSNEQIKLGGQFGYFSGRDVDKFAKYGGVENSHYFAGPETGVRLFSESYSAYECRLVNVVKTGDHHLFIGEVVGCYRGNSRVHNALHCIGPTCLNAGNH
ncbi:flavin reductase [Pelomyxa schiedti]|nr:flavin reductase [Pelomyxa schiedti]